MTRVSAIRLAGLLLLGSGPNLLAQAAPDPMTLSLDSLLNSKISSAAKYQQTISEAASSVTIITAEDIQRHGYSTLPEALAATRGFYLSYDRNYSFLGARGFSRPSDYNNRILVLVDGNATSCASGFGPLRHGPNRCVRDRPGRRSQQDPRRLRLPRAQARPPARCRPPGIRARLLQHSPLRRRLHHRR